MTARTSTLLLAAGLALGLAGCHRQTTDNPNAPGSPGTGNPTAKVTPAAPDTSPGQGLQGGMHAMGAAGTTAASPSGAASSSAPTGKDLQGGSPGTTYHSPGTN
jgi:hypothetical protein